MTEPLTHPSFSFPSSPALLLAAAPNVVVSAYLLHATSPVLPPASADHLPGFPYGLTPVAVFLPTGPSEPSFLAAVHQSLPSLAVAVCQDDGRVVWEATGKPVAVLPEPDTLPASPIAGFGVLRTRVQTSVAVDDVSSPALFTSHLASVLASGSFLFPNGDLLSASEPPTSTASTSTLADLVSGSAASTAGAGAGAGGSARSRGKSGGGKSSRGGAGASPVDVAPFGALVTPGSVGNLSVVQVPLLHVPPSTASQTTHTLSSCTPSTVVPYTLDVTVVLPADTPATDVVSTLASSLTHQNNVVAAAFTSAAAVPAVIGGFTFSPPEGPLLHPLSAVYAVPADGTKLNEGHSDLVAQRLALHHAAGLTADRPLFRIGAACPWVTRPAAADASSSSAAKPRLSDVHVGLPTKGTVGDVHLVRGSYQYYHYMQEGYDDKGWGCAYRSLQTLASWFRLNSYSTDPVPTHEAIQRALVAVGDKPRAFIGSRQWIGSHEVGFVLDELLSVETKFLFVPKGTDLPDFARQLAVHFDEQGTPVMMGGGNLAFTMLGIDWNDKTGDVRFLILDPHYTGADDLKTIQTKSLAMEGYRGYPVGWKTVRDFSANDFYGLCLPQRPTSTCV